MNHQYTITATLIDKDSKLYPRITEFNELFDEEIANLKLFALLSHSNTVEICTKKCASYEEAKRKAMEYLRVFMQDKKYIVI